VQESQGRKGNRGLNTGVVNRTGFFPALRFGKCLRSGCARKTRVAKCNRGLSSGLVYRTGFFPDQSQKLGLKRKIIFFVL
jgi:hypothetical protein